MREDLHSSKAAFDATEAVNDAEDAVIDAISAWMAADELVKKQ